MFLRRGPRNETAEETSPETPADAPAAASPDPSVAAALDLAASVAKWRQSGGRGASAATWSRLFDVAGIVIIAFAAVGIFLLGMMTQSRVNDSHDNGVQAVAAASPQAAAAGRVTVSADDDPARGPANARVTIIEFGDFQCPYCGQFHAQTLPLILQDYGDRVRFVYRDFPLTQLHPFAEKAAEASECAHEQGAFWPYHDLLFQNQSALDRVSLGKYATAVGLNMDTFNSCLDSGKYAAEVNKDEQDGIAAGVTGTPAFFINGQLISGAKPYAVFKAAIEAALQNTN